MQWKLSPRRVILRECRVVRLLPQVGQPVWDWLVCVWWRGQVVSQVQYVSLSITGKDNLMLGASCFFVSMLKLSIVTWQVIYLWHYQLVHLDSVILFTLKLLNGTIIRCKVSVFPAQRKQCLLPLVAWWHLNWSESCQWFTLVSQSSYLDIVWSGSFSLWTTGPLLS